MSYLLSLPKILVTIGKASERPNFELRFNLLQNTVIRRINDGIRRINAEHDNSREVDALRKKTKNLIDSIPFYETYRFGVESNRLKLVNLSTVITSAISKFSEVDDDTNLTAAEASDLATLQAQVVAGIRNLFIVKHPDVKDGDVIEGIKKLTDGLEALTPVAGVVDPEGTTTPTNDNRELLDTLTKLLNKVNVAETVSEDTKFLANKMILNFNKKILETESKLLDITALEAFKVADEIDALKDKYRALLLVISVSFEASSSLTDLLVDSIGPPRRPPPGSVMNLFV